MSLASGPPIASSVIGGKTVSMESKKSNNLVFLLDVSGSMEAPDKLPLVKSAMKMLVDHLDVDDRISLVVYAGASGLVLDGNAFQTQPPFSMHSIGLWLAGQQTGEPASSSLMPLRKSTFHLREIIE